jgi:hypothetical protein
MTLGLALTLRGDGDGGVGVEGQTPAFRTGEYPCANFVKNSIAIPKLVASRYSHSRMGDRRVL